MAAFHFELVSPERLIFSGEVEQVVVPGSEGVFTVLQNHAPMMAMIRPGVIEVVESAERTNKLFVRGGFADVSGKGLTIIAEQAIPVADLDSAKIDAELRAAEEDIEDASTDQARAAALLRRDQLSAMRAALNL
jgi:F-type H+-transporting ATPase subunit epsilon